MYGVVERAAKGEIWGNLKRRNDSRERRAAYQADHVELVDALCARELARAVRVMDAHLAPGRGEPVALVGVATQQFSVGCQQVATPALSPRCAQDRHARYAKTPQGVVRTGDEGIGAVRGNWRSHDVAAAPDPPRCSKRHGVSPGALNRGNVTGKSPSGTYSTPPGSGLATGFGSLPGSDVM